MSTPEKVVGENLGLNVRDAATRIEGLLDDDGHYNPEPERISRGHPDYDPENDDRNQRPRDERGRFQKAADDDAGDDAADEDEDLAAASNDRDEDTDADGDTDDDLAASADDEAEASDEETETVESLEQLATALDISLDDLKAQIKHTFRAADEDVTVTLAELEKGYQKDADYRRNTAKLADDRRGLELETQNRLQQFTTAHQDVANTLNMTERLLLEELESPALAQLRQDNPAEWTARREELGQRVQVLRNARQQAAMQFEQFTQQHMTQLREREMTALREAVPDWSTEKRDVAKESMATLGFSPEEINQVLDHRMIKGALELAALRKEVAELRELKTKATETVKRVRKEVPKLQKPGKQRMQGGAKIKRDNLTRLRERARKSGSVKDAAKVIEQFI